MCYTNVPIKKTKSDECMQKLALVICEKQQTSWINMWSLTQSILIWSVNACIANFKYFHKDCVASNLDKIFWKNQISTLRSCLQLSLGTWYVNITVRWKTITDKWNAFLSLSLVCFYYRKRQKFRGWKVLWFAGFIRYAGKSFAVFSITTFIHALTFRGAKV